MASVTTPPKPSIGVTLLLVAVVLIVGFIATQWVVGIILGIIRLIMILIGFYLVARIGLYLLRKGR